VRAPSALTQIQQFTHAVCCFCLQCLRSLRHRLAALGCDLSPLHERAQGRPYEEEAPTRWPYRGLCCLPAGTAQRRDEWLKLYAEALGPVQGQEQQQDGGRPRDAASTSTSTSASASASAWGTHEALLDEYYQQVARMVLLLTVP
jgi:hypothetical protein